MHTYFMVCGEYCKIGKAADIESRRSGVQTGNPLPVEVVHSIEGDVEREMHRRFRKQHERGEWFRIESDLASFLRNQSGHRKQSLTPKNDRPTPKDEILTTEQAAEYLGLKKTTLETWRCTKRYPLPFVRVGRAIRYRTSDLEAFMQSRMDY